MRYVVKRKRLKIGDSYREIGEEVPEASGWKNLRSYLDAGIIVAEQDEQASPASEIDEVSEVGEPDFSDMSRDELVEAAEAAGLDVPSRATKAEIRALLEG